MASTANPSVVGLAHLQLKSPGIAASNDLEDLPIDDIADLVAQVVAELHPVHRQVGEVHVGRWKTISKCMPPEVLGHLA